LHDPKCSSFIRVTDGLAGDGFIAFTDGGNDCFDNDPNINPGSGALCNYDVNCNVPADDANCGVIDCDGRNYYYSTGTASPTADNFCNIRDYVDVTTSRCEGYDNCYDPNSAVCTSFSDSPVTTCGVCKKAEGSCPSCTNYARPEPCGEGFICNGNGACIERKIKTCSSVGGPCNGATSGSISGACGVFCSPFSGSVSGPNCWPPSAGLGGHCYSFDFNSCSSGSYQGSQPNEGGCSPPITCTCN